MAAASNLSRLDTGTVSHRPRHASAEQATHYPSTWHMGSTVNLFIPAWVQLGLESSSLLRSSETKLFILVTTFYICFGVAHGHLSGLDPPMSCRGLVLPVVCTA